MQRVAVAARALRCRSAAPCRGGRRARSARRAPCSVRATTLCADALDLELGARRAQPRLDEVGERGFVAAHRRDRAELLGEREQIGHGSRHDAVLAQDRVELAACRAPRPRRGSAGSARTAGRTCRPRTPSCACPARRPRARGSRRAPTSSPVSASMTGVCRREDHARAELGAPPHARAVRRSCSATR